MPSLYPACKRIQLTPVGERFLNHARKILHDSRAAVEDLHQQPEAINGVVRIGIAETLSAYLLPNLWGDIAQRFPLLETAFHEAPASQLLQALRQEISILSFADLQYQPR